MDVNKTTTKLTKINELYRADLPPRACSVYLYLFQRRYNKESCFPAIATICADTKLSRSTVKRALNDLERAGFVKRLIRHRENGGQTSNLYMLAD